VTTSDERAEPIAAPARAAEPAAAPAGSWAGGRPAPNWQVWLALGTVYLVWGSTYLGIRVTVRYLPPLAAMGSRFVVAGVLMAAAVRLFSGRGSLRVSLPQLGSAALVGVLLLALGNGGVAVAEQTLPSGLAALLVAAMPLWLVALRALAGDRPRALTVVGTLVGFAGIAVLARPGSAGPGVHAWGALVVILATISWATGTFLSPRLAMPGSPFVATTYEMLAAGVAMLLGAAVSGELGGLQLAEAPAEGWWALAYLVVFGSLVAFTAFVWLTRSAPLSLVSTYAYVNPVVAVLLGWLILAEPLTAAVVAGGSLAVLGVAIVVRGESR
jgi:drug/metabolite transporter (DMT)-like permease